MIYYYYRNAMMSPFLSDTDFNAIVSSHISSLKQFAPSSKTISRGISTDDMLNITITETELLYNDWLSYSNSNKIDTTSRNGISRLLVILKIKILQRVGEFINQFRRTSSIITELFQTGIKNSEGYIILENGNILKESTTTNNTDILKQYKAESGNHVHASGNVKDWMFNTENKRYKLSKQLYRNLLRLTLMNAERPENLSLFFDSSVLKKEISNNHFADSAQIIVV